MDSNNNITNRTLRKDWREKERKATRAIENQQERRSRKKKAVDKEKLCKQVEKRNPCIPRNEALHK